MPPYKNASTTPRDLATGRVLAPGEIAEEGVDPSNAHDAALIDSGVLLARSATAEPEPPPPEPEAEQEQKPAPRAKRTTAKEDDE